MTDTVGRPLVRPVFLKWSLLIFVLLLPFMIHAAWDYYEARRVERAIAQIRSKNEPLIVQQVEQAPRTPEALRADRYYRAAAALAGQQAEWWGRPPVPAQTSLAYRVRQADRQDSWPDDLLAEMRRFVTSREDALRLLDIATPLTFQAFGPGTTYSYGTASLADAARLADLRTVVLTHDGDGQGAGRSLYAELRALRALDASSGFYISSISPTLADMVGRATRWINAIHPTAEMLAPIGAVLAELDRDDRLKQGFLRWRAGFVEAGRGQGLASGLGVTGPSVTWQLVLPAAVFRPWWERVLADRLEILAAIIAAVDQPWPNRTNAVTTTYARLGFPKEDKFGFKVADEGLVERTVSDLALVRSVRTAVAIEGYRREHGESMPGRLADLVPTYLDSVPVDPYSGRSVLVHQEARSYAVYSVGPNHRDDSGDFGALRVVRGRPERRDVGIRIQYR